MYRRHLEVLVPDSIYFGTLYTRCSLNTFYNEVFTAALALRSRGLVIGSREKEEEKEEKEEKEEEEEKNLQIAIRCLWDLFD